MAKEMKSWTGNQIVQTKYGTVKGFEDEVNTWVWKAIPYAKPPLGELRWKAPRDPEPWEGILQETEFCERCCQLDRNEKAIVGNEDCLRLNIWRPQSQEKELPVYFWIHGGGNRDQSPSLDKTNGTRIASQSNVIFVSINYRLGELGWLSHPALRSGKPGDEYDDSGNYGTLDIIKALTWVRDNIEAFGGNPANVFITGVSAGAVNSLTLLISPAAKGLFHKAMVQSGRPKAYSVAEGDARTNAIIAHLLINDGTAANQAEAEAYQDNMTLEQIAAYLRSKTFEELYRYRRIVPLNEKQVIAVFQDGAVISADGFNSLATGTYPNKVPVIIGMNKEEAKIALFRGVQFYLGNLTTAKLIENQKRKQQSSLDDEVYETVAAFASDLKKAYGCDEILRKLRTNADQPPVYGYQFLWGSGGYKGESAMPEPYGFRIGACHALDLPFFFGLSTSLGQLGNLLFTEENRPGREALTKAMMTYLAQFLHTGNPNKPGTDLPEWSPWSNDTGGPKCILLNANVNTIDIKMTTEELTLEGVRSKLKTLPEPLRSKAIEGVIEVGQYWRSIPTP